MVEWSFTWFDDSTGASSGIGAETSRVLALRGVNVVMGVRNMEAGREVKDKIVQQFPEAKVDAMELDLSSMASVRKFVSEYNSSNRPLNLLMWEPILSYSWHSEIFYFIMSIQLGVT